MDKYNNIFASSPCFDNLSELSDASTINDEIAAFIGYILTKGVNDALRERLRMCQEIHMVLMNSTEGDYEVEERFLDQVVEALDKISNEVQSPNGFLKPLGCEISTLIHILRTKARKLTRTYYNVQNKEKLNMDAHIALSSMLSNFYYYMALLENSKNGFQEEFFKDF